MFENENSGHHIEKYINKGVVLLSKLSMQELIETVLTGKSYTPDQYKDKVASDDSKTIKFSEFINTEIFRPVINVKNIEK